MVILNVNRWVLLSLVEQRFTKTNKINYDNPQLYKNPKLESYVFYYYLQPLSHLLLRAYIGSSEVKNLFGLISER